MTALEIGGRTIELTHPEKVIFADPGITKADLAHLYERLGEHMLPRLAGRPLVLQRFPDGIDAEGFMQKAVPDHYPDWLGRVQVPRRKGGHQTHLVLEASQTAGLVYLAQQACTTVHVFGCRVDDLDHPDELLVDLDPSTDDASDVVFAARALHDLLEEVGVRPFAKTTGSRGLHVHVDLDRSATTDEVMKAASYLAHELARLHSDLLTVEHLKAKRGDRLYLDIGRNGYAQHAVAAYTLRPTPGAPIATPVGWDEIGAGFEPRRWNASNIFRRLAQKVDPWADRRSEPIGAGELVRRLAAR